MTEVEYQNLCNYKISFQVKECYCFCFCFFLSCMWPQTCKKLPVMGVVIYLRDISMVE